MVPRWSPFKIIYWHQWLPYKMVALTKIEISSNDKNCYILSQSFMLMSC
jgi:hypothetical protein